LELGPHGGWSSTGSPDWLDIRGFRITHTNDNNTQSTVRVDELHFTGGHYFSSATDATSKTNYGTCDLDVIDERLTSDSECQKRAEALLYQKKDPPIQIDVTVEGNNNILVGDRLSMTIPAEGITAQNYDVISVEQSLTGGEGGLGWMTKPTMLNTANIREPVEADVIRALINAQKRIRLLGDNEKMVS